MPLVGFEPTIPKGEWPQTHTLGCTATAIGRMLTQNAIIFTLHPLPPPTHK
jgi:hypothetical protein